MTGKRYLNPIILREMRSRMRGRRTVIVLTCYVALMAALAGIIYAAIYDNYSSRYAYQLNNPSQVIPMAEFGPEFGRGLFTGTVLLLLALFSFIAPAFGAGAIAGEKERQTYDTLLITTLSARQIIWGKIGAIFSLLLLFIMLSLPIQSMAFFFGGVTLPDLLIATFGLIVSVLVFSALGLYISTLVRTTTIAIVISYAILVPVVYIVPFLAIILLEGPGSYWFNSGLSQTAQEILAYCAILIMSLNPFFAAIVSGIAAIEGEGYFFYEMSNQFPGNRNSDVWLPAPWITYSIFALGMMFLYVTLATRRIRKISNV